MKKLKSLLLGLFGSKVSSVLLTPWRKFYWWNKTRISPRENKALVAHFLNSRDAINIELGSSRRADLRDWIFTDINGNGDIKLDFTEPLPFPDSCADRIYSSHVLEHFSYPAPMLPFLKECLRILKPGGEFRVAVPDATNYIAGYNNPEQFDKAKYCEYDVGLKYESPIDFLNFIAYLGDEHKHLFDCHNLQQVLREAGFTSVVESEFDPQVDLLVRRHDSVYATGSK